ncbi:GGDEF domain-containing protein [Helicobacter sp. 11S03491-1]|uniref:GGDEF domain-containing protein n=1 Tax=Helicobacter sp. 11S03491-1 TaxID=1476196 RepID=UPI000BC6E204|nr:GGDEF domain-containing protein [Helicobacter sp. 11S03491-1]PAF42030.1 hypothetical protein BKH45_05470 [Helicobacter sp. 11S03491-1]
MANLKSTVEEIFKKLDKLPHLSKEKYVDLFVQELQKQNLDEKDWLKKYLDSLNHGIKGMFEYNIQTKDEFIQRLIMFLNASNSSKNSESLEETNVLLNALLKLLSEIASEQLKEEKAHLFVEKNLQTPQGIKELLEGWSDFIQNQEHLKLQKQISSIVSNFVQSYTTDFKPEFKEIVDVLNQTPQAITDANVLKSLEEISHYRNKDIGILNCNLFKKNGQEIKQNTIEILFEIDKVIENNNECVKEISNIKNAIVQAKNNFQEEKQNLISFSEVLSEKIIGVNTILKNKEEKIKYLYDELNTLSLYIKNIEEQSKLDNLTDVYNRKYIDSIAEVYEKQYQENFLNYSILFFDIDDFKNINDIYGHGAGDKILGIFSKILKQNCRGTDMVGRYGGDEFLILMPNTGLEEARGFANRICKTIENSNFIYKNQKIKITTSIGIADRSSYEDKSEMIDSADKFLYKAKRAGRNRVEWQ